MRAMRGSLNSSSGRNQDPPGGGEMEIIRWSKIPVRPSRPSRAILAEASSQLGLARCLSQPAGRGSVYLMECDTVY